MFRRSATANGLSPVGPGRTGHQTASWRVLNFTAAAAVLALAGLTAFGLVLLPIVAFIAIGAGAGYSLSGSV